MSFTVALQYNVAGQGAGTPGQARAIERILLGAVCTALNGGSNGTATGWAFEWLSVPDDSAIALGVAQTGAGTTYDFTPDVVGMWLLKITLTDGSTTTSDYRAFAVLAPGGYYVPCFIPPNLDPLRAFNFGGQTKGWYTFLDPFLKNSTSQPSTVYADVLQWVDENWRDFAKEMPKVFTRRTIEFIADGSEIELGITNGPSLRALVPSDGVIMATLVVSMNDGTNVVTVRQSASFVRVGVGAPTLVGTADTSTKDPGTTGWTAGLAIVGNSITVLATAAADVVAHAVVAATQC